MKRKRFCLIPECGVPVRRARLLCGQHWYALPSELRDKVRGLILSGDSDSARIVLADHFAAERIAELKGTRNDWL